VKYVQHYGEEHGLYEPFNMTRPYQLHQQLSLATLNVVDKTMSSTQQHVLFFVIIKHASVKLV